ncbi:hypothetical protein ZWY2020_037802 [Hordeum vulgare]|nr:hypothetical protein ZWY2020_037802 [Hordeum vulgare]
MSKEPAPAEDDGAERSRQRRWVAALLVALLAVDVRSRSFPSISSLSHAGICGGGEGRDGRVGDGEIHAAICTSGTASPPTPPTRRRSAASSVVTSSTPPATASPPSAPRIS